MHRITFKKSVFKDLAKISKENLTRIFHKMEKDLSRNPEQYPELKGKFAGLRKYRVGDYRILFVILDETVLLTRVKHRRKAHKYPSHSSPHLCHREERKRRGNPAKV